MAGSWFRFLSAVRPFRKPRPATCRPSLELLEDRFLPSISTLIPTTAVWKYLDNGTDQGAAWRDVAFTDTSWASGAAELGYGDGDETTVVGFGPSGSNRYITTYFRHAFDIGSATFSSLNLQLRRDDGAVVYVNGTEAFRSNMPAGAINYTTKASSSVGGDDEDTLFTASVNPALLVAGQNVVAVEVHQSAPTSSDLSFALGLSGETSAPPGPNDPPTLAAIGAKSVSEQSALTFTAQGSDPNLPADTLTYGLLAGATAVPSGASINASTGAFNWTPAEAQDGSYSFKVRVTDAAGAFAEEEIAVTVNETNQLPVLAAIGNKVVSPGNLLTFTISATDADLVGGTPNALTYAATGLPTGAIFDAGTRTFSWTPDSNQIGSHPVTFSVSDGLGEDSENITIEVTTQTVPVTLSFQDGVSGYSGTRDTQIVSTSANANYGTINALTVDGDPDKAALLKWDLDAIPQGSVVQSVTLGLNVVDPSSQAYNIYEMKRDWQEGQATWNVFATGQGWEAVGALGAQDKGSTILGTVTSSNNGLKTFTLNASGVALVQSWVNTPGANRGFLIQNYVSATNGLDFSTRENTTAANRPKLTITYLSGSVGPNHSPTLAAIGPKSVDEHSALTFTAQGSDTDLPGDSLTYSLQAGGTAVPSGATINPTTGAFAWTPGESQDGSHSFKVRVTDAAGAFAEEEIAVTVGEVNSLPVLAAIGNKTVAPGSALSFTISATDADLVNGAGNTLTYSATGLPGGATFNTSTRVFSWTPEASQAGSHPVSFNVSDGLGNDFENITIEVATQTTPVTTSFQDGVSGYSGTRDTYISGSSMNTNYGTVNPLNLDGDPDKAVLLKWDLATIPRGSTVQAVTIGLNVAEKSGHTYEIYEMKQNWVEGQATWGIFASGAGNTWQTAGANGSLDRGSTVLATVVASTTGFKSFAWTSAGIALVQSWVNQPGNNRGIVIQDYVSATDGMDISSREFATAASRPKLTVTYLPGSGDPPPNQAPDAVNDTFSVPQGQSTTLPVLANDSDPDGDAIGVVSVTQPSHGSLTNNGGVLSYTPTSGYTGSDSFSYTIHDSLGLADTATVSLTVFTPSSTTFRVMGDVPYSSSEFAPLEDDLANVGPSDQFFVHVGDIKSGSAACTSSYYTQVANTLKTSPIPLFIVPGDNEWTDCSNPSTAWGYWDANFMGFEDNWDHNFNVSHQTSRPENFSFVQNGILFIGLNLPGGSAHNAPDWNSVVQADATWITQNFNQYGSQVNSVVLFAQAYPDDDRQQAGNALVAAAQAFDKPVLYMMGDLHSWLVDNPFSAAPNITRVIVDSGSPSVRVTVSGDPDNPYVFDRTP